MLAYSAQDLILEPFAGIPGVWVKLADIDFVNDIPPEGTNGAGHPTALRTNDGNFGGFVLPIAFGALNDLTGLWTSCFMLLFAIVVVCFLWMHLAIRRMGRAAESQALSYAAQ